MKHFSMVIFSVLFLSASVGWGQQQYTQDSPERLQFDKDKYANEEKKANEAKEKSSCTSAIERYDKVAGDNPCSGSANPADCEKQIDECVETANTAFGGESDSSDATDALMGIIGQYTSAKSATGEEGTAKPNNACFSKFSVNDERIKQERKARMEESKRLKKEIEEARKDIAELNKKMSEKKSEVAKEANRLDREMREKLKSLDGEQKESAKKQVETIKAKTENTLKLQNEIVKAKRQMDDEKFNYQNKMLNYTSGKINDRCQSAISTAKQCFLKARSGNVDKSDATCASVIALGQIGKGIAGTADLKKKLLTIRSACFEGENIAAKTEARNHSTSLQDLDMKIKDYNTQIESNAKEIGDAEKEFKELTATNEKEKKQIESDTQTDKNTLQQEITELAKNNQESIDNSNAIIQDKQRQLNALAAGTLTSDLDSGDGSGGSYYKDIASIGKGKIQSILRSAKSAYSICKCDPKLKAALTDAEICSALSTDSGTAKRSTRKSGTGSKR